MSVPPPTLLKGDLTDDLYGAFRAAGRVAWDIETSDRHWQTDRIGTCQLHAPGVATAVVQLGAAVPDRLSGLLADPELTKVFHHAMFDLRFMRASWGVVPANVACTKIAVKHLDPGAPSAAHSLQPVLQKHLGVEISKEQQVTDWLASDLTPEQLAYAAADVVHLLPLADKLERDLVAAGEMRWYRMCMDFLPARVELEVRNFPDVFAYASASWSGGPMQPAPARHGRPAAIPGERRAAESR